MKQIILEKIGKVQINDSNFIAEGGEAKVYKINQFAAKIYHNVKKSISDKKINELKLINDDNVLYPLGNVFDLNNNLVGFYMKHIKNAEPLCKLFTKSYKKKQNISFNDVVEIIKSMQCSVNNIHKANCLVGDMNELNILVKDKQPTFIDVDSYKTTSFPCSAIAESIRDRTVPFGTFTKETDWYAFAILIFQLYIGIHPYKGKHPDYKISDWQKRMEDGISVFEQGVRLPPVCNSFSVIPPNHLNWLKEIFVNKERSCPPLLDGSIPIQIKTMVVKIDGNDKFDIEIIEKTDKTILNVFDVFGIKYFLTNNGVFSNKKLIDENKEKAKIYVVGHNGFGYIVKYKNKQLKIYKDNVCLFEIVADKVNVRKNEVYFISNDNLYYVEITELATKTIISPQLRTQVFVDTAEFYHGVIHQQLPSYQSIYIPFPNKVIQTKIKEFDKYRIIDMKMKQNICVAVGEKQNKYSLFVLIFNKDYSKYDCKILEDVDYIGINFTVLDNGVCIMYSKTNELHIFKDINKVKIIEDTPIDSSMMLKSFNNNVFVFTDNELLKISLK